ncbi:hypothetical protein EDD85DRAFT_992033 [Armillaria nabsnona]|nr:hypothetical protein EDD85DRAFT_992033 [Armillaria nabsnona]
MAAHELASGRVVLERAVLLSRNIATDAMKTSSGSDGAEFKTFVLQMYTIALQQAAYTPNPRLRQFVPVAAQQLQDVQLLFRKAKKGKKAILKRASDEPELGIVDAILTANTRALSADNIVEPEEELAISEECAQTSGFSRPGSKHARSTKSRSQLGSIAEDQGGIGQASQRLTGRKKANGGELLHSFAVTCSETKSAPEMVLPHGVVMNVKDLLTKLLLAVLFAEYKKPTQTYAKALVQAKMYLEASVRYLASLGVTKKAVFALATDGVEGAVLMAWCSGDSEANSFLLLLYLHVHLVLDRLYCRAQRADVQYLLAHEVYHFVTVLIRLREYGDTTLKEAVEAALKGEDFKQTSWNKTAQFNRMESG